MKLNNRAHCHGAPDEPLQPSSAYMVDPAPLNGYLKNYIDQKEVGLFSALSLEHASLL
jgi:hypothetical protein